MNLYRIHITNEHFRQSNEGEHVDLEAALRTAMRGALQIGTDEICGGKNYFGADVTVALDGEILERRLVSVGATPVKMPIDAT